MRRRQLISNLAAASLPLPLQDQPLCDIAAARNIVFGTEITLADIMNSPTYASLVARECAIVTPGIEAKWPSVEPREGGFEFNMLDRLVRFALGHGLRLHMHNLIWAVGLPTWTTDALSEGRGDAVMARHITTEVGRYRGLVDSWDVINEPVDPRWPSAVEGLCTSPWRLALGADFVPMALRNAHAADVNAMLLINDDDLEYDTPDRERKRTIYLRLIERWLGQGVPLTGFGLEAHIKPWQPIADIAYRRFLRGLPEFGLRIYVTEFDICDRFMPADIDARDNAIAAATRHYLDLVLDEPAVQTVITWGLSDAATWMLHDPAGCRPDGLLPRPLPYDARLQPKKMRTVLAACFRAAPTRPAPHGI